MSLINQMLRDLEARQARNLSPNELFAGIRSSYEISHPKSLWYSVFQILLVLLLAFFVSGMLYYLYTEWRHAVVSRKSIKQIVTNTVLVSPKQHVAQAVESPIPAIASIPAMTIVTSSAESSQIASKSEHAKAEIIKRSPPPLKQSIKALAAMSHGNFYAPEEATDQVKTQIPSTPEELARQQYQEAEQLIEQRSFPEAIETLRKVLQLAPKFHPARLALAELLEKHQDIAAATALIQEGLRENPQAVDFIQAQAQLFLTQEKPLLALKILNTIKPQLEDNPDYYALMAGVYHHLGEYSQAISIYRKLLSYNPSNSVWWLGLGVSCEQQGSRKAAIAAFRHAHDLYSLQPTLQNYVDARLDALGG